MKLSINALAQEVHWLCGMLAVIVALEYRLPWWVGGSVILLIALVKEASWDTAPEPWGENAPFLWNGARDWFFYAVGVATGWAVFVVLLPAFLAL